MKTLVIMRGYLYVGFRIGNFETNLEKYIFQGYITPWDEAYQILI